MKDLLSKEHCCYKIHIFFIKISAFPLHLPQTPPPRPPRPPRPPPPIWTTTIFTRRSWSLPSMIFQRYHLPLPSPLIFSFKSKGILSCSACMKRKTLCNCLYSSSCDSACLIQCWGIRSKKIFFRSLNS